MLHCLFRQWQRGTVFRTSTLPRIVLWRACIIDVFVYTRRPFVRLRGLLEAFISHFIISCLCLRLEGPRSSLDLQPLLDSSSSFLFDFREDEFVFWFCSSFDGRYYSISLLFRLRTLLESFMRVCIFKTLGFDVKHCLCRETMWYR